jgi:hypothetical protein
MKNIIIVLALLVNILGCCSAQTNSETTQFTKEIPATDLFYKLSQQKAKQLKIDSLENGFDSLQIRIWYDYSLITLRKLLIVKQTNSAWSARAYTMTVDWNAYKLTEKVKIKKEEKLSPKNGWDSFSKRIMDLQITTLPNMVDIPGLKDHWLDGMTYNVEVATKTQYRFYRYHLPDKFQDKYWQAKNMVDILKLVEAEFGITN